MIVEATSQTIRLAAEALRGGRLVAFPTETVYGLGGDATNDHAIASIYQAKGRPSFNPLILHVDDAAKLDGIVVWNQLARSLAAAFWPGPLTFVLPRAQGAPVSLLASAGLDTLAVRVPDHEVARALLREVGRPVAAPSANASGRLSPTSAQDVWDSLGDKVAMILEAGDCAVGVESTVVDLTSAVPCVLRPGGVTLEQLRGVLGDVVLAGASSAAPKSPGLLSSHYAPNCQVRLNAWAALDDEAFLMFGDEALFSGGRVRLNLSPSGDLKEAAAHLFSMLRKLDAQGVRAIAVAPVPMTGLGLAINDRLARAAAPRE